jgi:hypothetical protein
LQCSSFRAADTGTLDEDALSAGVTSLRINGIIAAAWSRRSDFTDNRPSLGAVRNRTAHWAIGDRLENWKRLADRLPVTGIAFT